MSSFEELVKVDCSAHVEKKGKFTYLSWPFAFAELFKRHPKAEIDVREWDGFPAIRGPKGWFVQVSVTIDGVRRSQWHPVLDNNNRPIMEPNVFDLNTSIQRGAVKAIALHGLGLYIYAGEDLPEGAEPAPEPQHQPSPVSTIDASPTRGVWDGLDTDTQIGLEKLAIRVRDFLDAGDAAAAYNVIENEKLEADEKVGLWTRFNSKERSALTKAAAQAKTNKEAA